MESFLCLYSHFVFDPFSSAMQNMQKRENALMEAVDELRYLLKGNHKRLLFDHPQLLLLYSQQNEDLIAKLKASMQREVELRSDAGEHTLRFLFVCVRLLLIDDGQCLL